jgi:hypothetical protein
MAELKTKKTRARVGAFLDGIEDPQRRADCRKLHRLMKEITGKAPRMWGDSIVGYGDVHMRYASGREVDWFQVGFSPRKASLSVYLMCDLDAQRPQLAKLGKHKTGRSCLTINQLDDVDLGVLRRLVEQTVKRQKSSG